MQAPVAARFDAWIIGDLFVHDNYYAYQDAHTEEKDSSKHGLYLFDYYNVKCFTANPLSPERNVVTRILNAFIKALNDFVRIPKTVVIIPELDMLCYIEFYDKDASEAFEEIINGLITKIQRAIQSKKDHLINKNPGAIIPGDPSIVWIAVMDQLKSDDAVLSLRQKFNNMLEEVIADRKSHYLIDVCDVVEQPSLYNRQGLNDDGKSEYWRAIDRRLKSFDMDKEEFKPKKKSEPRFRLPRPTHWECRDNLERRRRDRDDSRDDQYRRANKSTYNRY